MKNYLLFIAFLFGLSWTALAQVNSNIEQPISIDTTGTDPDTSAILDVESTSRGLLIPRMSSTQRVNITLPARGLLVYDTTMNIVCHYDGSAWLCPANCETLDMAYDCGGPGFGRTIFVDTGAVNLIGSSTTMSTLEVSAVSATDAARFVQGGQGSTIKIDQVNPTTTSSSLDVSNNGLGGAMVARTLNFFNSASTIEVEQLGMNHAGNFKTSNPIDSTATIRAEHIGQGDGIHGIASTVDTFGRSGVVGTGRGTAGSAAALHAHDGAIRVSKTSAANTPAEKVDIQLTSWLPMDDCGAGGCGGPAGDGDLHAWNSDVILIPNVYVDPVRSIIIHSVETPVPNVGIKAITKNLATGGFTVQFVLDADFCSGLCAPPIPFPVRLHYLIVNL